MFQNGLARWADTRRRTPPPASAAEHFSILAHEYLGFLITILDSSLLAPTSHIFALRNEQVGINNMVTQKRVMILLLPSSLHSSAIAVVVLSLLLSVFC